MTFNQVAILLGRKETIVTISYETDSIITLLVILWQHTVLRDDAFTVIAFWVGKKEVCNMNSDVICEKDNCKDF